MIRMELQIEIKNRSVSVSKQLRNYPSPSPRFIVTRYQLINIDIDPKEYYYSKNTHHKHAGVRP